CERQDRQRIAGILVLDDEKTGERQEHAGELEPPPPTPRHHEADGQKEAGRGAEERRQRDGIDRERGPRPWVRMPRLRGLLERAIRDLRGHPHEPWPVP